jgi:SAM-dependent methyltransferase
MIGFDRAWLCLGQQLQKPSGIGGLLVAQIMGLLNEKSYSIAVSALKIDDGDTVLELGFGPGRTIAALSKATTAGRVLGIDHSAAMYRQASRRNRAAISGGRVSLVCGRLDTLPWKPASIDKCVAIHVAYFMDTAEIREARRVLRPGGILAVLVTEKDAMKNWRFVNSATHRKFGTSDLFELLEAGGFFPEEISVRPVALGMGVRGLLALARKHEACRKD